MKILGIALVIILAAGIIANVAGPHAQTTAPQPTKQTLSAKEADKKLEACRAKLKEAKNIDLLNDLRWDGRSSPQVLVGPTFFRVPLGTKERFADTVNCFLMAGKEDGCVNFNISDGLSGRTVATYHNCRYVP